jgi:hypothetical protein
MEQLVVMAQVVRGSDHERHDVTVGDRVEERKQLSPDSIASKPWFGIGGVGHRLQVELLAQCMGLGAPQRQNRVARARCHCRQSGRPAPAEECKEQCFGLIIGGVPGERIGADEFTSCGSRPGLKIGAVGELGVFASKAGAKLVGNTASGERIIIARWSQTVIDVDGGDRKATSYREGYERSRIRATRKSADDRGAGRRKIATSKEVAHKSGRLDVQRSWWRRCLPPGCFFDCTLSM